MSVRPPVRVCVFIYDSISTLATSTILSGPCPAEPALSRMKALTHTEEVTVCGDVRGGLGRGLPFHHRAHHTLRALS